MNEINLSEYITEYYAEGYCNTDWDKKHEIEAEKADVEYENL